MDLDRLGWTDFFAEGLNALGQADLTPARVVSEFQGVYRLLGPDLGDTLAEVAGKLRFEARGREDFPAVGDWVAATPPPSGEGRAVIRAVLPRKSKFSRKVAGEGEEQQIVAANVDVVFLVASCDRQFNLRRLERFVTVAWSSGAQPAIVLTKADLADDPESYRAQAEEIAPGVPIVVTSAKTHQGLEALAPFLKPGETVALLGTSGAGKSTLLNALRGEEVQTTADVRLGDAKGRHTTTHRELFALPSGALVIDTPGMRELQLWSVGDAADSVFEDVAEIAAECRFRDCSHESEPGCAVRDAVERGELPPARVASFMKLRREAAATQRREDPRARQAARQRWKTINRAMRRQRQDEGAD